VLVLVGDDWAEDHHDAGLMDLSGRTLARARLAGGAAGIAGLHAMLGEHLGQDDDEAAVRVGIETGRGPWVTALVAAGYAVYAINPLQAARAHKDTDLAAVPASAPAALPAAGFLPRRARGGCGPGRSRCAGAAG
jgi:transposase